jgi:hypothetical protein
MQTRGHAATTRSAVSANTTAIRRLKHRNSQIRAISAVENLIPVRVARAIRRACRPSIAGRLPHDFARLR